MIASSRRFLLLGAVCLALVPGCGRKAKPVESPLLAARDWKQFPAIVEVETSETIYALGDVHGDYDRLVTLLLGAGLLAEDPPVPAKARWGAGKAVLVCTGDLIDKWPHSLRVLTLFQALQEDASQAGGRVIVLAGNHEAEFLAAQGKGKKFASFVTELAAAGIKLSDVVSGEAPVGAWLRALPFAARVDKWFFAHAGNTAGRTLKQLDEDLRAGVDSKGFGAAVLSGEDSLLQARLSPRPWWEKGGESAEASRRRLKGNLAALGVERMAIGHQPGAVRFADGSRRKAGELTQYAGLVFMIDTGMSRGVGYSTGAMLRIEGGKASAVGADGKVRAIWP